MHLTLSLLPPAPNPRPRTIDLKTANIFIKHNDILRVRPTRVGPLSPISLGRAKRPLSSRRPVAHQVGDLGVAAQLEHSLDMRTTCVGSPYYLSPEV